MAFKFKPIHGCHPPLQLKEIFENEAFSTWKKEHFINKTYLTNWGWKKLWQKEVTSKT